VKVFALTRGFSDHVHGRTLVKLNRRYLSAWEKVSEQTSKPSAAVRSSTTKLLAVIDTLPADVELGASRASRDSRTFDASRQTNS
jgi:hypothetical protein